MFQNIFRSNHLSIFAVFIIAVSTLAAHSQTAHRNNFSSDFTNRFFALKSNYSQDSSLFQNPFLNSDRMPAFAGMAPENAACTTMSISAGQSINESLSTSDCFGSNRYFDRYSFSGTAGQRIRIAMNSNNFETLVNLFDPNSQQINLTDLGTGNNTLVELTLPLTGTYLILASSQPENITNGAYTITLNNIDCTPTQIDSGQTISNVSLSTSDCIGSRGYFDDYTFSGTSGQQVTFTMSSTAFDTYLELYNSAAQRIAFDDDGGGGTNSRLVFTLPAAGTYTIRSTSFSANETGEYTIAFLPPPSITVSGRIKNVNDRTLSIGVNLNVNNCTSGFSASFAVSGSYNISIPQNSGNCRITPSGGGVFNWGPPDRTVNIGTQNITDIDFTPATPTYNVVGTINNLANTNNVSVTFKRDNASTSNACSFNPSNGAYVCSGLTIYGDYTVTPSQPGTTFDPTMRQYPSITGNVTGANYTASQGFSISGRVTKDGSPSSGIEIRLEGTGGINEFRITDSNGNYSFANLPSGGNYSVFPVQIGGLYIIPERQTFENLSANQTANFTAHRPVGIRGRLARSSDPFTFYSINLNCANGFTRIVTGIIDDFFISAPENIGSCTVNPSDPPSQSNLRWNPPSIDITVGTQDINGLNFSLIRPAFNIVGTLNNLANASGTVVKVNGNGIVDVDCPINSSNIYTCSNLPIGGNYTVKPSHPTFSFDPIERLHTNLQNNLSNQNFTAMPTSHSINGQVTRNGVALGGVTVTLFGNAVGQQTRTTDLNGNYSFTDLPPGGTYIVTPSLARHTFSPPSRRFDNLSTSQNNVNFTAVTCTPIQVSLGQTINNAALTSSDCIEAHRVSDIYAFNAAAGQSITVEMSGVRFEGNSSEYFSKLELYDSNGGLLQSNNSTLTPFSRNSRIVYTIPATGTYTVLATTVDEYPEPPASIPVATYSIAFLRNATVSGRLKNVNGDAISGLGVELFVNCGFYQDYKQASGDYSIQLPEGNCTIAPNTESRDGSFPPVIRAWSPASRTISVGTQNITGIDFTAQAPTFDVVGTLNNLTNTNGVSLTLSLTNTGTIIPDACEFNTTTRNYICRGLVIFGNYTITPSQPNTVFDPGSRNYTIVNHVVGDNYTASQLPALSIGSSSITEGNSGITAMNFTVNLSAPSNQAVTVNYSTANGSATAGQDYQAVTNGTVTIPANQTSGTATVQVIGDTIDESNETFTVTLSNPSSGATIAAGQGTATGTIIDDDTGGSLQFSASNFTVNESAANASVTVTRTGGAASGVTVICESTAGGTASPNEDYTPVTRTLTFDANVMSQTCSIPILDNSVNEPSETVKLLLRTPTGGATLGSPVNADLTILDDDSAEVFITIQTNPAGRSFTVDGVPYNSTQVFQWLPGSEHTISTTAQQSGSIGTRYVWSNWSDNGGIAHTITAPTTESIYTANFTTQYQLTVNANPSNGGSVTPTGGAWYNSGQIVQLSAAANNGFRFSGWTGTGIGSYTGANSSPTITMSSPITETANFNQISTRPAQFDFDGDRRADVSVFRPSDATWYVLQSQAGFAAATFGLATDRLAPADYDGDGRTDVAVFRENPNDAERANFYILQSSNNTFRDVQFGSTGDVPVPADYDGDGRADAAVYRGGAAAGAQSFFFYLSSSPSGGGNTAVQWGSSGDKPVAADFDGDGRADIGIYRPSSGAWYVMQSRDGFFGVAFGTAEDKPVAADYDGDGKSDIAVFRPSSGAWYVQQSRDGFAGVQFGIGTDKPVAADYDGDGRTDIAVYRPETGGWYILQSRDGFGAVAFGTATDKPVPFAFVH